MLSSLHPPTVPGTLIKQVKVRTVIYLKGSFLRNCICPFFDTGRRKCNHFNDYKNVCLFLKLSTYLLHLCTWQGHSQTYLEGVLGHTREAIVGRACSNRAHAELPDLVCPAKLRDPVWLHGAHDGWTQNRECRKHERERGAVRELQREIHGDREMNTNGNTNK